MSENALLDADSHVSEPLNLWQRALAGKVPGYRAAYGDGIPGTARRLVVY